MTDKFVLVTGGAGYIGSHVAVELLASGFNVVILDNFSNSSLRVFERIEKISGKRPRMIKGDVRDVNVVNAIFKDYKRDSVLHFAGLKSVGESVSNPLAYYDNNFSGTVNLLAAMANASVYKFVFSSSATVYGKYCEMPVSESCKNLDPSNPYGRTKLMLESLLTDLCQSDRRWRVAVLRYFNPIGAHESGLLGEDPSGTPSNLLPYISKVAIGNLSKVQVFGRDYDTPDGTGIRDYIHVMDLALGHLQALRVLNEREGIGLWNLGTGRGYSVLEVIRMFELVSNKEIPFEFVERRRGDVANCFADPSKAKSELNWVANKGLKEMIVDTWNWQLKNPNGYH